MVAESTISVAATFAPRTFPIGPQRAPRPMQERCRQMGSRSLSRVVPLDGAPFVLDEAPEHSVPVAAAVALPRELAAQRLALVDRPPAVHGAPLRWGGWASSRSGWARRCSCGAGSCRLPIEPSRIGWGHPHRARVRGRADPIAAARAAERRPHSTPPEPEACERVAGHYRVRRYLSRGSSSDVYLARPGGPSSIRSAAARACWLSRSCARRSRSSGPWRSRGLPCHLS
jgi:hypothetical protein